MIVINISTIDVGSRSGGRAQLDPRGTTTGQRALSSFFLPGDGVLPETDLAFSKTTLRIFPPPAQFLSPTHFLAPSHPSSPPRSRPSGTDPA